MPRGVVTPVYVGRSFGSPIRIRDGRGEGRSTCLAVGVVHRREAVGLRVRRTAPTGSCPAVRPLRGGPE